MTPARYAGALAMAMALVLAACGSGESDRGASTSTTPTSSVPTMTPAPAAAPGTRVAFRDYLATIGVTGAPARFDDTPGLQVTVPVPEGWARTGDPLFATGIDFVQPLDSKGTYPSATLMVIGLNGNFDPKDAIRHANSDALPPTATGVTESYDDYQGFPSAAKQGVTGGTQHYSRIVIATVPSGKRYLVQLTATTLLTEPIDRSPALSSVVTGLKVAVS